MADSLTTKRSQRVREAICRKSAQTFHLPLVKYEDEYNFKLMVYSDKNVRFCIVKLPMMQADDFKSRSATFSVIFIRFRQFLLS